MEVIEKKVEVQKYSDYKDSGVEWLGEIPVEWETSKLKYLSHIKTGDKDTVDRQKNGTYPFFIRSPKVQRINSFTYDEEAVLTAGDGDIGKIFHYIDGKFECHQRVYKFSNFQRLSGKFLFYYLHRNLEQEVVKLSAKTTVDSLRLPMLQNFVLAIPPEEEQEVIVEFLDKKIGLIDKSIGIKQKQIDLLKEQRKILVHKAVTRGLNSDATLKSSGVDWIGDIPKYWKVRKAKYLFFEVKEKSQSGEEELLSVSHTTGVTPRSEKDVNMFLAEDYSGSRLCKKGDVVFNIMWAWMGALGVTETDGIVSPSYGVYRQEDPNSFNPVYLEELLKSQKYVEYYNKVSTGLHSSRLRFYPDMFFDMKIGYPPRKEQNEIVSYIKNVSSKIHNAIELLKNEKKLLQEYRETIIYKAVTGKIKVS